MNYNRQLYYVATGAEVPRSTAENLLCFYDYGKQKYIEFKTNRFVQKDTSFSSTTKKIYIPNLLTQEHVKTKTKSAKLSPKHLSAPHKSFQMARSCSIPIAEILHYNLFPTYSI